MEKKAVADTNNQPVAGNSDFNLTSEQQKDLLAKANAKDAGASLRLYYYYDFVKMDHPEAMKWLKRAADLNLPKAKYTLGYFYFHFPDESSKDSKAAKYREYWIEEAAKSGDPEAIAALKKQ